jgi:hypothetical protein
MRVGQKEPCDKCRLDGLARDASMLVARLDLRDEGGFWRVEFANRGSGHRATCEEAVGGLVGRWYYGRRFSWRFLACIHATATKPAVAKPGQKVGRSGHAAGAARTG